MTHIFPRFRALSGASAAVLAAALAAACSDGGQPLAPAPSVPGTPAAPVAAVRCSADVASLALTCDGGLQGARGDRIIGGQGVNVKLTSTNVVYDSVAQVFSADLTVQNLLIQRLGADGVSTTGVRVFFHSGPTATSGTGAVSVANPDGVGLFTGSEQPYFEYAGSLGYQQVSAARNWKWSLPKTVGHFDFTVYVSAPVVPVVVFDMTVSGNTDVYRMGIDGNDLVKLSTAALTDQRPTTAAGSVVFTSFRDGNAELYSVPLKGGAETRLTTTPTYAETAPALSPDGSRLAFANSISGGQARIWTSLANGAAASRLASLIVADPIEATPAWADSTRLAYVSTASGGADIWTLTLGDTARLMPGNSSSYSDVEPAWSPDRTKIVFASNRTGDTELYMVTLATGALTRLTTRTGSDGGPSFLADGRIVYVCYQATTPRLCLMDPATPGTATMLTTPQAANHPAAVRY